MSDELTREESQSYLKEVKALAGSALLPENVRSVYEQLETRLSAVLNDAGVISAGLVANFFGEQERMVSNEDRRMIQEIGLPMMRKIGEYMVRRDKPDYRGSEPHAER